MERIEKAITEKSKEGGIEDSRKKGIEKEGEKTRKI